MYVQYSIILSVVQQTFCIETRARVRFRTRRLFSCVFCLAWQEGRRAAQGEPAGRQMRRTTPSLGAYGTGRQVRAARTARPPPSVRRHAPSRTHVITVYSLPFACDARVSNVVHDRFAAADERNQ